MNDDLIRAVLNRGFEIRLEQWGGPAVTITDPNDPRGGCGSLRGEGSGATFADAIEDACRQALNDHYPQATACGRGVLRYANGGGTSCVLAKVHDGDCIDSDGNRFVN